VPDAIRLRNIRVWGKHGVPLEERQSAQPFDLDITIEVDLKAARMSDELSDTIDYSRILEQVISVVENNSFCLMERLGQEILGLVLSDDRVIAATVTIAKPQFLKGATPEITVSTDRRQAVGAADALRGLTLKS